MKNNIKQILEEKADREELRELINAKFNQVNKFEKGSVEEQELIGNVLRSFKNPRSSKSQTFIRELNTEGLVFKSDWKDYNDPKSLDGEKFNQTAKIKKGLLNLSEKSKGRE